MGDNHAASREVCGRGSGVAHSGAVTGIALLDGDEALLLSVATDGLAKVKAHAPQPLRASARALDRLCLYAFVCCSLYVFVHVYDRLMCMCLRVFILLCVYARAYGHRHHCDVRRYGSYSRFRSQSMEAAAFYW